MPLFVCTECRTVENTALAQGGFHSHDRRRDGNALCSACQTGEWHGRFEREIYNGSQNVQWIDGAWISDG